MLSHESSNRGAVGRGCAVIDTEFSSLSGSSNSPVGSTTPWKGLFLNRTVTWSPALNIDFSTLLAGFLLMATK